MRIPKPCLSVVRLSICPYPEKRNHHNFVNISPTLVIDASMGRSSRVLRHGNPKILFFFFQKSSKFEICLLTNSWNHLSFVNISPTLVANWYINGKVFTSTTPWKHKNLNFFSKKFEFWLAVKIWNHLSLVNISHTLVMIHKWKGMHEYYNIESQK